MGPVLCVGGTRQSLGAPGGAAAAQCPRGRDSWPPPALPSAPPRPGAGSALAWGAGSPRPLRRARRGWGGGEATAPAHGDPRAVAGPAPPSPGPGAAGAGRLAPAERSTARCPVPVGRGADPRPHAPSSRRPRGAGRRFLPKREPLRALWAAETPLSSKVTQNRSLENIAALTWEPGARMAAGRDHDVHAALSRPPGPAPGLRFRPAPSPSSCETTGTRRGPCSPGQRTSSRRTGPRGQRLLVRPAWGLRSSVPTLYDPMALSDQARSGRARGQLTSARRGRSTCPPWEEARSLASRRCERALSQDPAAKSWVVSRPSKAASPLSSPCLPSVWSQEDALCLRLGCWSWNGLGRTNSPRPELCVSWE